MRKAIVSLLVLVVFSTAIFAEAPRAANIAQQTQSVAVATQEFTVAAFDVNADIQVAKLGAADTFKADSLFASVTALPLTDTESELVEGGLFQLVVCVAIALVVSSYNQPH